MLFSGKNSLEELICTELQAGSVPTTLLIERIREHRPKTTKQGVYAALRELRRDEVVVTHAKKASLNVRWLKQMDEFFSIAQQHYVEDSFGRDNFLNLKDGEKIAYFFSTPTETDKFWGHALVLLAEADAVAEEPVYLYNPHEWFLVARHESERAYFDIITKKKRLLVTAGDKTPLDRAVAGEFDGDRSQYHTLEHALFPKNNYYFNIVGDFLLEVWIEPSIATRIEDVYRTAGTINEDVMNQLVEIARARGRSKLSISRNAKKAGRLKKMLCKNFYIPASK